MTIENEIETEKKNSEIRVDLNINNYVYNWNIKLLQQRKQQVI